MFSKKLLHAIFAIWTVASSSILPCQAYRRHDRRGDLIDVPDVSKSGYTVPLEGSETCRTPQDCANSLSRPASNRQLRFLTLARGIDSWTCLDRTPTEKPLFVSQNTTLWDAAPLLNNFSDEETFHSIVTQMYEFDYTDLGNSSLSCLGSITTIHGDSVVEVGSIEPFPVYVQQIVKAPELTELNLAWSHSKSIDLEWDIYRVETVGGAPPTTCEHQHGPFELNYAAEYWFYHI